MIRITVELLPKGDETRKRTLGRMDIANDATGDVETGHYLGTLHAEYTKPEGRRGRVTAFNRRKQSVWSLVGAFLKLWGHTKHSPLLMHTKEVSPPAVPAVDDGICHAYMEHGLGHGGKGCGLPKGHEGNHEDGPVPAESPEDARSGI